MKAIVQRVSKSNVKVGEKEIAAIDKGLNVLVGVSRDDTVKDAKYLAEKITNLRIFEDENSKLNLSVKNINGQILLISQFTLIGDISKGRRPSFQNAAEPDKALELFNKVRDLLEREVDVKTGKFGAKMIVGIENNGPVTIIIEGKK